MNNSTENDNINESSTLTSKTVETVEKPKKQKRKFEWTPKRKAAFEKCVAARKNQIQQVQLPVQSKTKQKNRKMYSSSSSDTSVSSSSSDEEYNRPKRKGIKKQFYKLKKDLIYNMKKSLRPQKNYLQTENDNDDYYYPHSLPSRQSTTSYTETSSPPIVPAPTQQQTQSPQPTQNSTPKYCFL
jgi:hypothetical protein